MARSLASELISNDAEWTTIEMPRPGGAESVPRPEALGQKLVQVFKKLGERRDQSRRRFPATLLRRAHRHEDNGALGQVLAYVALRRWFER